jgi:hypothetical protein
VVAPGYGPVRFGGLGAPASALRVERLFKPL